MHVARLGALLAVGMMLVTVGCGRSVPGSAHPDPHAPGTAISSDGFGIIAGDPKAEIQIELYTEPQCSHCAHLQGEYGRQMKSLINLGDLAITYRPVTFFDLDGSTYSARVSNALFLAAERTSGPAFQTYVAQVWGHQQPLGPGPTDAELAEMAHDSQVDGGAVERIKSGRSAVNTAAMSDANEVRLQRILRGNPATPVVFDLHRNTMIDTSDEDWLTKLMASKIAT